MKKNALIFALGCLLCHIGINAQSLVYYEYTPTVTNKPDQLLRTVTAPCELESREGTPPRLPMDETIVSSHSTQSLRLKWTSKPTGNWIASIRWSGNALYDITQYDSLSFYLYSQDLTNPANLPYISFLTKNIANADVESAAIPMGNYVSSLPVGQWIEVSIPVSAFLNAAGNPADVNFAKFAQIRFKKGLADDVQHTINLDFIRINKKLNPPIVTQIKGYDAHVELFLKTPASGSGDKYAIYRSDDGGNSFSLLAQVAKTDTFYMDWIGKATAQKEYKYRVVSVNTSDPEINSDPVEVAATVHPFTDNELMEMTLESTFRFYWDYAFPQSGLMPQSLGRRGWNQSNVGNTGFMILAYIMGVERGYITKEQAIERLQKTCATFMNLKRQYGAIGVFDSNYTGDGKPLTGATNKSAIGDGGMLAEGLICARQYFDGNNALEKNMRDSLTQVYESMDWSVHARPSNSLVYWSALLNNGQMTDDNFQVKAVLELLSGYYMGAGSSTHPLPKDSYRASWMSDADGKKNVYLKGQYTYGQYLDIMSNTAAPLFAMQYYFFAVNPWNLTDGLCDDYGVLARNFGLGHYNFTNSKSNVSKSVSDASWGTNAVSGPYGYNDGRQTSFDGTIAPYTALGSMPYTPVESKRALEHYYYDMGDKMYTRYGFYNSFNLDTIMPDGNYFVEKDFTYCGITMVFLENYLSQFFWKLGEKDTTIQNGLEACGLYYKDGITNKTAPEPISLKDGLIGWYKADSANITGTNDDITGWKDLSGKGHDLIKTGSGKISLNKDTLNGHNTVQISNITQGSNNYFKASLGNGLKGHNVSAYVVAKIDKANANNSILMAVGKQGSTVKESEDRDGAVLFMAGSTQSDGNSNPKWGLMRVDTLGAKKSAYSQSSMPTGNGFSIQGTHFEEGLIINNSNGENDTKINQYAVTPSFDIVQDGSISRKVFNKEQTTYNLNFKKFDANELRLGGSAFTQTNLYIDAQVAEVLLFDKDKYTQGLDKVILSYLAIKYGIEQNNGMRGVWDYQRPDGSVIWDGSYAIGYKNGVAGIGRSDYMGLDQRQSVCGTVGEEMSFSTGSKFGEKSAFLQDESYLMWGNNKLGIDTFQTVSGFADIKMSKKIWRLSVSDLGSLPVSASINLHSVVSRIDTTKDMGILLANNPEFSGAQFISGTFKNDSLIVNKIQFSNDSIYFIALGTQPRVVPEPQDTPVINNPIVNVCLNEVQAYSTAAGKFNYIWTITGGSITQGQGTENVTIAWNTDGTGTLKVGYSDTSSSTAVESEVTNITVHALPVITTTSQSICSETSIDLATMVTNPSKCALSFYTTATGETALSSSIVSPDVTTIYYVEATNANNCTSASRTPITLSVIDHLPETLHFVEYPNPAIIGQTYHVKLADYANVTKYTWSYSQDGVTFSPETGVVNENETWASFGTLSAGTGILKVVLELPCGIREVTQAINVTYPTGIKDISSDQIQIYPNPTAGLLKISGTQANQTIRIIDIMGSLKGTYQAQDNATTIDLTGYAKGTYLIQYNEVTQKVIRE